MDAIRNKENVNGAALMAFAAEWDGQEMGVMVLLEEQTDINVY